MIQNYINKIIKGDCLTILKQIPDNSINLIFADPPYFMQTEGELMRHDGSKFAGVEDKWDKFANYEEYDSFCYNWLKECKRILTTDGTIWVIGSFQNIYRIGYIMQNLNFWILNDVIWSKPNAVPNFNGKRLQNSHETMIWCSKNKTSKYTFNYKTMKSLNGDKQEKSVWDIGICIGNERIKNADGKKAHSTQKPERLLYKIILSASKPEDIVLDPFFGTGTTGAIAKKLGRNWIGIEKETEYIQIAEKRIDDTFQENNIMQYLDLEVKPPKVPLKELVNTGYIKTGQQLFNKYGAPICRVTDSGNVTDGQEISSIHKMSAKYLKKTNNNGWEYFYFEQNGKFISLNSLRYKYTEEH